MNDTRICTFAGCTTRLSIYRPHDDRCSIHTPPKRTYADLFPRWMQQANCIEIGTDTFDVELPSTGRMTAPVLRAKAICHDCPVADRCIALAFELETFADLVWGGLTGRERMAICRRDDRIERAAAIRLQQSVIYGFAADATFDEGEVA